MQVFPCSFWCLWRFLYSWNASFDRHVSKTRVLQPNNHTSARTGTRTHHAHAHTNFCTHSWQIEPNLPVRLNSNLWCVYSTQWFSFSLTSAELSTISLIASLSSLSPPPETPHLPSLQIYQKTHVKQISHSGSPSDLATQSHTTRSATQSYTTRSSLRRPSNTTCIHRGRRWCGDRNHGLVCA